MVQRRKTIRPKENYNELLYYGDHFSLPILSIFILALVSVSLHAYLNGFDIVLHTLLFGVVIILFLAFFKLKVLVDRNSISLIYGIGFFEDTIFLGEIESYAIKPNRFIRTWFYLPNSAYVLQIRFRGGGRALIPAEEPKKLAAMLRLRSE